MEKEELESVLKESLALEEKGYQWYTEGVHKIKNSLGRRMLKRLAEDELNHIRRINNIYESLTKNSLNSVKIEKPDMAVFDDLFKRMKDQLEDAVEELTVVGVNDEEIINVALELEANSRFYYEEAAKKSTDTQVKQFYELLAREEKNHQELLQRTNEYLANPSLFFGMDGR